MLSSILVQALLEAMGASGSSGQEAVANAEINAAILTARAGARDPSAVPSICRVSAALQYPAGEYIIIFDVLNCYRLFPGVVYPYQRCMIWRRVWDGRSSTFFSLFWLK